MKQDLTGRTFGYLTVVKRAEKGDSRHRYWVCNCICGNEKIVEESHLKNGHTKSCGCYRKEVRQGKGNDLRGMRFGRLTAVCLTSAQDDKEQYWLCRCDCGNLAVCRGIQLRTGAAKSCGCLQKEKPIRPAGGLSAERIANRKTYTNNTSGHRGVYRKGRDRWRAAIGIGGKVYHLGTFLTYGEAVTARREAENRFYEMFQAGHEEERLEKQDSLGEKRQG